MSNELSHAEVLGRYVGAFVDELVAAGVENVCLCPGSRSTPLALTFARHPGIKTWMHLDERSCAYFALGLSTVRSPVAILCSSGTAAANFAPAVIEAYHSQRPLIVLTADRPPELQGLGANQTIDQVGLYGSAVRWLLNMPLPEASDHMLRYARMAARRGVMAALGDPPGPVHLNFPFREPLMPDEAAPPQPLGTAVNSPGVPEAAEAVTAKAPSTALTSRFAKAERPLIVCGPYSRVPHHLLQELAEHGVPVLTDPLSGFRCTPFYVPGVIGAYDGFLRSQAVARSLKPDLILRTGAPPTSKPLATYLQLHRDVPQVQLAPPGTWPDPDLTAAEVIHTDGREDWKALVAGEPSPLASWSEAWRRVEELTTEAIRVVIDELCDVSEPSAILDLAAVLPEYHTVFAGNSMPVRDIDSFWPAEKKLLFFEGNRGASGIDGVVSTALGASARTSRPVVAVIGDQSFYHDMNGLLAARRFGLKATIVLINNGGGGIFSFLPQHKDAEHFEALWGTPHGLDFSHVAGLYGVGFQRVTTREEYKEALKASFWAEGVQVIEVKTHREENLRLHQRIWDEVARAVKDVALP